MMKQITLIASFVVLCSLASAKPPDAVEEWNALKTLPHDNNYYLVTNSGECFQGPIAHIGSDRLILSSWTSGKARVSFAKKDILAFGFARHFYYSNRNSWYDASHTILYDHESLVIATRSGKRYKVQGKYTFTPESITFPDGQTERSLAKADVERIYLDAVKPLSAGRAYALGELGLGVVFDGDAYRYWWHLEGRLSVLLYDASQPEDNRPISCVK